MLNWFVKKINNRKGFTLIELIVVVAILGILGALAVTKLGPSRQTAIVNAHNANVRTLESVGSMWLADNAVPTDKKTLTKDDVNKYLQKWPDMVKGIPTGIGTEYTLEVGTDGTITVTPKRVKLDDSGAIVTE